MMSATISLHQTPKKSNNNNAGALHPSQSTPISRKTGNAHQHGTTPTTEHQSGKKGQNADLAQEMAGHFVEPMEPRMFLDEFLPLPDGKVTRDSDANRRSRVADQASESAMYIPFINAANSLSPSFYFVNTFSKQDLMCDKLTPNVSV